MESVSNLNSRPAAKPQSDPPAEILRDLMFALAIAMSRRPRAVPGLSKLRKQIDRIQRQVLSEVSR
jgi:hypothetical protein